MDDTILIVDDEESIRVSLEGILSDEGFITESVSDGKEALERLTSGKNYLGVITDNHMKEMDGEKLIEELGKRNIIYPIILMSGGEIPYTDLKGLYPGNLIFIEKPFQYDDLFHKIDECFLE